MENEVRGAWTRADGGGELASRRNKKARDFTQPFFHKYTLLSTYFHCGCKLHTALFHLLSLSFQVRCPQSGVFGYDCVKAGNGPLHTPEDEEHRIFPAR